MTDIGEVIRTKDNEVELRMDGGERCGSCPQAGGCHASIDLGIAGGRRLVAQCRLTTRVGDRVEVTIPEEHRLRAGLVVFGLPVLLAALGAVLGSVIGGTDGGDLATGIGAGSGLALGIATSVTIDRRTGRWSSGLPWVVRVLDRAVPDCHQRS